MPPWINRIGLRKPFKKGQSGNPRGRPKEAWWDCPKSDRVEPILREQLLRIALDWRVKIETRVRVSRCGPPQPTQNHRTRRKASINLPR